MVDERVARQLRRNFDCCALREPMMVIDGCGGRMQTRSPNQKTPVAPKTGANGERPGAKKTAATN